MYKITFPSGNIITIEKPNFIYGYKKNCFLPCEREKADGINYLGSPFLFKNGTMIQEFDAGIELDNLNKQNLLQQEHLAEVDEIAIDLYEQNLALEAINAE